MRDDMVDVTALLDDWRAGSEDALAAMMPIVYGELHRIASSALRREGRQITLQPTSLVNELYLKVANNSQINWKNRSHFFAVVAKLMRQILVDHARKRGASKRDGGQQITLTGLASDTSLDHIELLAIDGALNELEGIHPRNAQIVDLRFFGGLTNEETASALGVSVQTVKRGWRASRAWLADAIDGVGPS